MKSRTGIGCLAVFLLFGGVSLFAQSPPSPLYGLVKGVVTDDSTGLPLRGAFVDFFSIRGIWTTGFGFTDSLGRYSVRLDTGSYFGLALKLGYFPEWYDNVRTRDSARTISVSSGDTLSADFRLHPIPPPILVNVSGTVTDSVSGLPLAGAIVGFFRPFHWPLVAEIPGGLLPVFPPPTLEPPTIGPFPIPSVSWIARTDSAGKYAVRVVAGATLIAGAFKFGYVLEFYDDKHSPFEADKLTFSHDSTGIDFDLIPVPSLTSSLSGAVVDSMRRGVRSHLLLIHMIGGPGSLAPWRLYYGTTDSAGHYSFDHLPEGSYVVQAIPMSQYLPAWYDADSCGVRSWTAADIVHVVGSVTGIDICVRSLTTAGVGEIAGKVYASPDNGSLTDALGVGGAVVYALSHASNQVLGFDVSDGDGSYDIQNLPPGSYDLAVDKEGYSSPPAQEFTLDAGNNYGVTRASITISPVSPLGVGSGGGEIPRAFALGQNYPNPFNPTTTLSYEIGRSSFVVLKVYDIIGREVATLVNGVKEPGVYRAEWNAANFPSGVYTYRLVAGSFSATRRMVLIR